jgi:hypothetical protein
LISGSNQIEQLGVYPSIYFNNNSIVEENYTEFKYLYLKNKSRYANISQIIFKFEFHREGLKNIISGFSTKQSEDFPQIYAARMYFLYNSNLFLNFSLKNFTSFYTLNTKWIDGWLGKSNFYLNEYENTIIFSRNYRGKPMAIQINKSLKYMNFSSQNNEFVFYCKLDYNKINKGIEEVNIGETRGEIMISRNFPIYYYLDFYFDDDHSKRDIFLNINIRLNSYNISVLKNDFEIKGYIIDKDSIDRIMNGEYILLKESGSFNGNYIESYGYGFLQIQKEFNKTNISYDNINDEQYVLISLSNKDHNNINSPLLVEIVSKEKSNESYFMPINQYLIETFNQNENLNVNINNYTIDINDRLDKGRGNCLSDVMIEFSPNYNDIILNLNEGNETKIIYEEYNYHGFKKFRITNTSERQNQINFNVINTRNRKDANYLIRYFYTDVRDENNYTLDIYTNKDDTAKNNQDSDIVSVWFDFKNINVTRDSKPLNNTNYTITFYINAFLFPKDNTEVELVNTSAIIHNRKYLYRAEAQSMYNYDKSFTINFTNISREHNYKYDLQLKVNVFIRDRIQNEEFLTFTYEVDLTDIAKKDNTILIIFLSVIGGLIVISVIAIPLLIYYRKLKKDNSQLKEQVLDIGFSANIQKNILKKEVKSKKDEDYETEFI